MRWRRAELAAVLGAMIDDYEVMRKGPGANLCDSLDLTDPLTTYCLL